MARDPSTMDDRPNRPPYIPGTPEEFDAVVAAPENHEIVFENDRVRVVRVLVRPGEVEKQHTHKWPSVFTVSSMPKINYYNDKGELCPPRGTRREGVPFWVEPEGIHWVENVDARPLEGIRIELKG